MGAAEGGLGTELGGEGVKITGKITFKMLGTNLIWPSHEVGTITDEDGDAERARPWSGHLSPCG